MGKTYVSKSWSMKLSRIDPRIEYVDLPARKRGQRSTKSCETARSQKDSVGKGNAVDLTCRNGCIQRSIA